MNSSPITATPIPTKGSPTSVSGEVNAPPLTTPKCSHWLLPANTSSPILAQPGKRSTSSQTRPPPSRTSSHPGQAMLLIFIRHITSALERDPNLRITLDWCPGHSRVVGNEITDTLANDARPLPGVYKHSPTSTHLKTKQQRRSMKRWKRSLRHPSPGIVFTSQMPISSSPSATFKDTTKELFGRLTQPSREGGDLRGTFSAVFRCELGSDVL